MAQKAPLQIAGVIYDVFVKKVFVKKKKKILGTATQMTVYLLGGQNQKMV